MQRYRFATQYVQGKRVLDAACGVGYGSRMLLEAGAREVVAVDRSAEALELARRHYASPEIRFVCDDCESLRQVTGPFDVIVAMECIEHFDAPKFLQRASALLTETGMLVGSTPNAAVTSTPGKATPENPFHLREFDPAEFESMLREFFLNVNLRGQNHSAAYALAADQVRLIYANPFMRLGRWLQRVRGRTVSPSWPPFPVCPTEADYCISEANLEAAFVLVAVCSVPRRS
jgi:2-polyprenyl-3-methyl-5-hydroxy-6-metoxy-1,4-benzoquinol methylase